MVTYVNTKVNKWSLRDWFIARDWVDDFKVYGETDAHLSEKKVASMSRVKTPYVDNNRL